MKSPEVSIIVPVYKVEDYLERCVKSVLAQTYTDFELILVDDGSPDRCGEMCDVFAKDDSRIHVIHKKNGGVSDARNVGMDVARGQYLFFVDPDDYIYEQSIEKLHSLIKDSDAQLAIGSVNNCFETGDWPQCAQKETYICTGVQAFKDMLEGKKVPGSACGKLFSKNLCVDHRFPLNKTYEDAFFLPTVLLETPKVVVTTEPLYNYWHRAGSITTGQITDKVMDVVRAYEYTEQVVERYCPELRPQANFRLFWSYFVVLDRLIKFSNYRNFPQYKEVICYLKHNWKSVYKCTYFSISRRISAVLLKINVNLYRLVFKLNQKEYGVHS